MRKHLVAIIVGVVILGLFGWTLVFLYNKSQAKPVVFETDTPFRTDIVHKTVATGAIVPRQDVEIKPRVSGVVEELYVEPGQYVEQGAQIAKIKIIPDVVSLNNAEAAVNRARISFDNAKRELDRYRKLYDQKVISDTELQRWVLEYELKKEELAAATSNLQLVKEGAARGSNKVSNVVTTTVPGMVLEVPVEVGDSVIESNTFNAGTTIASVADMRDMIFEGKVDESEVGKIKEGMELMITIGALENVKFKGKLEYIAPKGVLQDGSIQFEIKAAIEPVEGVFIRAGYSANADIVLARRTDVLAIRESTIIFERDKAFVEVEVAPQRFERRPIEVGLSDGIQIEVTSGLTEDTRIKKPLRTGQR